MGVRHHAGFQPEPGLNHRIRLQWVLPCLNLTMSFDERDAGPYNHRQHSRVQLVVLHVLRLDVLDRPSGLGFRSSKEY